MQEMPETIVLEWKLTIVVYASTTASHYVHTNRRLAFTKADRHAPTTRKIVATIVGDHHHPIENENGLPIESESENVHPYENVNVVVAMIAPDQVRILVNENDFFF